MHWTKCAVTELDIDTHNPSETTNNDNKIFIAQYNSEITLQQIYNNKPQN